MLNPGATPAASSDNEQSWPADPPARNRPLCDGPRGSGLKSAPESGLGSARGKNALQNPLIIRAGGSGPGGPARGPAITGGLPRGGPRNRRERPGEGHSAPRRGERGTGVGARAAADAQKRSSRVPGRSAHSARWPAGRECVASEIAQPPGPLARRCRGSRMPAARNAPGRPRRAP